MLNARLIYGFWGLRLACAVQSAISGLIVFNTANHPTRLAGIISLAAGLLIFTPLAKNAERFLIGWLLFLAVLAVTIEGAYDVPVYDVVLAVEVFVLLRLTQVNESAAAAVALVPGPSRLTLSPGPALISRQQQVLGSWRAASIAPSGGGWSAGRLDAPRELRSRWLSFSADSPAESSNRTY